jgi:hypothetical protein
MGGCEANPRLSRKGIFFKKMESGTNMSGNAYRNFKTPVKLEFILQNLEEGNKYQVAVQLPEAKSNFMTEEITSPKVV